METYTKEDLEKLGLSYDSETETLLSSSDLNLTGNVNVNVNLKIDGRFSCSGFVRAKKISATSKVNVEDFLCCDSINAYSLNVKGNLLYAPQGITCASMLIAHGKVDSGNIDSKIIIVHGPIDALKISAEKFTIYSNISCKSLVSK